MIKKTVAAVFLLLCILLLGGSLYTWHIEKLDAVIRLELQKYAKENLPVDLHPGRIEFQLIPLNLTVHNLKIHPKKDLARDLKPLEIKSIRLRPSFMHMLIGKFHLAKIVIDSAQVRYSTRLKDSNEEIDIQLKKWLQMVPITQVRLSNINLDLKIATGDQTYDITTTNLDTVVTNDVNSLMINLKIADLSNRFNGKIVTQQALFETRFFLTEKNLVLSDFKFKEDKSFIVASGSTQHNLRKKMIRSGNLNVRTQIDSVRARQLVDIFNPKDKANPLKDFGGDLRTDLRVQFTEGNKYIATVDAVLQKFSFEKFQIGDIHAKASFNSVTQDIHASEVNFSNSGAKARLKNVKMNLNELAFKDAELTVEQFNLYKYLNYSLGLKIPADVDALGKIICAGRVENFRIDCTGGLTAQNIFVSPAEEPLIQLTRAFAEGSVTVDAQEISYKAQISTAKSKGSSHGTINFKTGFLINYETPALDLSEVKKISVLDVDGIAKINGSTQGDSHAATFEMIVDGKNLSLSKYKLGDASLNLKYKSEKIMADKIQGSLMSSRYLGQLLVDLDQNTISGKIQFPFVDLSVVKDAIYAHLPIPVDIAGSGSAIVNLDSPLNPDKLSFKAKARLYNCRIDQQHVDTAEIDISSELGKMTFNSAYFEEKNSNMLFKGLIHLDTKEFDLAFTSQRIQLDDLSYSRTYAAPTKGVFQLNGTLKKSFTKPSLDFRFTSDNFSLAGQKLSPLTGNFKVTDSLNHVVVEGPNNLNFVYKDIKSTPDIHFEGTTQSMNLAPLLTSMMALDGLDDYSILASTNFNLKLNRNDFSKVNGYVFFPSLQINSQKLDLKNEKDVSLFFTNGKVNFATFSMNGKGGRLQLKSSPNSVLPVDIQISGLFSLSFLHLFAPFLETLEGQTSVNFNVQKQQSKWRFYGSSFIDDGFIKLPAIQHAVEDLKVDILFNQDQILVNSLKGKFASGQLIGDGKIVLKGAKDIPTMLRLHLDNVDLNIPPQVNTIGSGQLQLSGNWLPFTLSGTYEVSDGLISKEFTGGEATALNPHQLFLPLALRSESISPIILDLAITPLAPLKIKNSMVDGKIEGKIKVSGYPETPILGGNISLIRNSQLTFRGIIFRVRDSSIGLNNSNPPNPALYILADARHKGYDIEMLIQGTAEKPKIKLTSQPTLTEPEIISLITLGYTSVENAQNLNTTNTTLNTISGAPTNQNSLEVGTDMFSQNPLGKEFKDRFGFDVQFSSKFDSANSVAVPKISAAKQFSERLSGIGSIQTGRDSRREVKLRYELDRGFAATMSLQSQGQEEANQQRGNNLSDILGIDLEFRKEFK